MTTPCQLCGHEIPYEPIDGFPAIVPRVCGSCGSSSAFDEDKARDVAARAKREEIWNEMCPASYRIISEGGLTDMARLSNDHPMDWPDFTREQPGLMLVGPSGRGKTRWAWRCLRTEFDSGKTILTFTARGFEAAYREADGQHKLKSFLDECGNAGCFFLDDLGKAGWSANTLETFYEIVEVRGSRLRPIFISTNFTGAGLSEHLRLDSAIMEPLIRRLREFCRCIAL